MVDATSTGFPYINKNIFHIFSILNEKASIPSLNFPKFYSWNTMLKTSATVISDKELKVNK